MYKETKKVLAYKTNRAILVTDTCVEMAKKITEMQGNTVSFSPKQISKICLENMRNNKLKRYRGIVFRYVEM